MSYYLKVLSQQNNIIDHTCSHAGIYSHIYSNFDRELREHYYGDVSIFNQKTTQIFLFNNCTSNIIRYYRFKLNYKNEKEN